MHGRGQTGGLVGLVAGDESENGDEVPDKALISESFATGDINVPSGWAGGLVGVAFWATIERSYATGNLTAADGVLAGLVSRAYDTSIVDCYARGNIETQHFAAGLVNSTHDTITNSYSASRTVARNESPLGLAGLVGSAEEPVVASYWDMEISSVDSSHGGEARTTAEMTYPAAENTYVGWDFTEVWDAGDESSPNDGYPFHRWQTTRHTLEYQAGPGGTLTGETTQSRLPGANGAPVTAVADEGLAFLRWSDGSTANPRTDRNVTEDLSVTAEFGDPVAESWVVY